MAGRSLLIAALVSLLVLGCGRSPTPDEITELSAVAPALLNETDSGDIPRAQWPAALVQLNAERVRARPEGLYVVLSSAGVEEHGLFVPRAAGFTASAGTDPSYTPVGQGVYSYRVKG